MPLTGGSPTVTEAVTGFDVSIVVGVAGLLSSPQLQNDNENTTALNAPFFFMSSFRPATKDD